MVRIRLTRRNFELRCSTIDLLQSANGLADGY